MAVNAHVVPDRNAPLVSIGIFARNEEPVIAGMLRALFAQTLIPRLVAEGARCEIYCVVNGSRDRTAEVAAAELADQRRVRPDRDSFRSEVATIATPGKLNAWNQFVHRISDSGAEYLLLMDADIQFAGPECLWQLLETLRRNPEATVAVDEPIKRLPGLGAASLRGWLSRRAAQATAAAEAQLCAQLYAIRAAVARRIYMPRDLPACEDGWIKSLVCTDFGTKASDPCRISLAPGAAHYFVAYTAAVDLVRNQKRQVMGQTVVHLLMDSFLPGLQTEERQHLARVLRDRDMADPDWLKRRLGEHLKERRFFWRLYPHQVGLRVRRLARLRPARRLACLPAALLGLGIELIGSFLAWRELRRGHTHYWPEAPRPSSGECRHPVTATP